MLYGEKKDAKELEELKRMFKLVLDTIPSRVFWKDTESVYQGANSSFLKDAGVKNETHLQGKTDYDMPWKKSETDFYRDIDKRVMSTNKVEYNIIESQTQSNGKQAWTETNKAPITDTKGKVIGVLGTYIDITDRIEDEIKLKAHTRQLEAKNKELEQFAFIASHDLQEPLNTIISFVNILSDSYKEELDESGKQIIRHIEEATVRMKTLISGILEYSRLGTDMTLSRTDMNRVVDQAIQNLKSKINESNAVVTFDNLPKINGYKDILPVLFQNLISNAIKFRHPDQSPVIHISCKSQRKQHLFTVEDNGIGIDPKKKDRIFQIFQKLHSSKEYAGHGIGLSHCKKIVDLHGGEIWVESAPKKGSKFKFTIPK